MRTLALLLAFVLASPVTVPQTAEACGNPMQLAGNTAVRKVRELETMLRAGKHRDVLRHAHTVVFAGPRLRARADLVFTVAAMRLGRSRIPGSWSREFPDEGDVTPLERLRRLRADAGDDSPLLDARIAEALLRSGTTEDVDEASRLLEDLAARDVVPDAEAWASLADVRRREDDRAGSDAAMERCKKTARRDRRSAVCTLPDLDS